MSIDNTPGIVGAVRTALPSPEVVMETFKIVLSFEGVEFHDEEQAEELAVNVPDVMWAMVDGEVRALGLIDAPRAVDAAFQLVTAVHEAVPDARPTRVVEDLVSVADVAERTGFSRQYVLMLAKGERGPGGFPAPRGQVSRNQKIWDWEPVKVWFLEHYPTLGMDDFTVRSLTRDDATDIDRALRDRKLLGASMTGTS